METVDLLKSFYASFRTGMEFVVLRPKRPASSQYIYVKNIPVTEYIDNIVIIGETRCTVTINTTYSETQSTWELREICSTSFFCRIT